MRCLLRFDSGLGALLARRARQLGWLLALGLFGSMVGAQTSLPRPVQEALRAAAIDEADVGVWVMPLGGTQPVVAHQSEVAFNPASTMKLLTTHAALARWGADYRWLTALLMRGRRHGDTLWGDLVLRGSGDPKLVVEDLEAMVAALRASGLRVIQGNLVIDDALYATGGLAVDATDGALAEPYNVYPNAALLNFKALQLSVRPLPQGAQVRFDPPLAGVPVRLAIQLIKETACREGVAGLSVVEGGSEQAPNILIHGRYSVGCGEQATQVSVLNHRQFTEALFRSVWQRAGGSWSGRAVVEQGSLASLPVVLNWTSPRSLGEVVRDVNKFSNNVMARQLFWHAGLDGRPARSVTLEQARAAVKSWLERRGLYARGTVLDNGSGLSRHERLTPAALGRILIDAAQSEHGPVFIDSLPIVGVDGTMRRRLRTDPVAGHAHIKTGSLSDVRSIAGYVDAASGRRYALVMLVNGPRAAASAPAQDALLRWAFRLP